MERHRVFGTRLAVSYVDRKGAYLIPIRDDKIGVVETKKGFFFLGGGIEENETDAECIMRECLEEIGCIAVVKEFVCSAETYTKHSDIGYFHPVQAYYTGELKPQVKVPTEFDHKLVWVSYEKLKGKLFLEMQNWALKRAIEGNRRSKNEGERAMTEKSEAFAISEVFDQAEKQKITREILEALPEWFGLPESREEYIAESADKIFFCAYRKEKPIGFLYLKQTGEDTAELAAMGVLKDYHRNGVGRALFERAKQAVKERGYSFLQVKTVQTGKYAEYDQTNLFYRSLGFKEFEIFPTLWDEWNPCQVYVMAV